MDTNSVVEQSDRGITFRVDHVKPAKNLLANKPVKQQLQRQCGRPFLTLSHESSFQVVRAPEFHPLVAAVHLAFSEHRPLLLTPDSIWMVIAQGFAHHVNNHSERLRKRFVRHEGKITLQVQSFDLSKREAWADVIDMWSEREKL